MKGLLPHGGKKELSGLAAMKVLREQGLFLQMIALTNVDKREGFTTPTIIDRSNREKEELKLLVLLQ
jgi:hypothetical protein